MGQMLVERITRPLPAAGWHTHFLQRWAWRNTSGISSLYPLCSRQVPFYDSHQSRMSFLSRCLAVKPPRAPCVQSGQARAQASRRWGRRAHCCWSFRVLSVRQLSCARMDCLVSLDTSWSHSVTPTPLLCVELCEPPRAHPSPQGAAWRGDGRRGSSGRPWFPSEPRQKYWGR